MSVPDRTLALVGDCDQPLAATLACEGQDFVGTIDVGACSVRGPVEVRARFVAHDRIEGELGGFLSTDHGTGHVTTSFVLTRP